MAGRHRFTGGLPHAAGRSSPGDGPDRVRGALAADLRHPTGAGGLAPIGAGGPALIEAGGPALTGAGGPALIGAGERALIGVGALALVGVGAHRPGAAA